MPHRQGSEQARNVSSETDPSLIATLVATASGNLVSSQEELSEALTSPEKWWRGDLNPRPAGYESASHSTEDPVTTRAYALVQSSVAPQVAILTDDNGCLEVMIPDDLSELIRLWPMLDEAIQSALLALARVGSDR